MLLVLQKPAKPRPVETCHRYLNTFRWVPLLLGRTALLNSSMLSAHVQTPGIAEQP